MSYFQNSQDSSAAYHLSLEHPTAKITVFAGNTKDDVIPLKAPLHSDGLLPALSHFLNIKPTETATTTQQRSLWDGKDLYVVPERSFLGHYWNYGWSDSRMRGTLFAIFVSLSAKKDLVQAFLSNLATSKTPFTSLGALVKDTELSEMVAPSFYDYLISIGCNEAYIEELVYGAYRGVGRSVPGPGREKLKFLGSRGSAL